MDPTEQRKADHVALTLDPGSVVSTNAWDDVTLLHEALPETDLDRVRLGTRFLGHDLGAPLMIASMTGGYKGATEVNGNLAAAAAARGVAMGLGSQRAALGRPDLEATYAVVRDHDVPFVAANIGAPQLVPQGDADPLALDDVDHLVSMVEADALIIHLNALQEVVQPEGDTAMEGVSHAIERVAEHVDIPVIAKETGAGMHRRTMARLAGLGISAIDVGGHGGTSFALVEGSRAEAAGDDERGHRARLFGEWGVPTPLAVLEAGDDVPIIATGGLRHGLDVARALALGADMAGMARTVLRPATEGPDEALAAVDQVLDGLRTACFLTGSDGPEELRTAPVLLEHRLGATARALGHDVTALAAGRLGPQR